jgi:hypothetical protein
MQANQASTIGKKISPGGTFDSSPVRSAGKLCKKICPSRGDDRTPGSWSVYSFASTSNHRSSLRDGRVFFTISRSGSCRIPGYYQMSLRDINGPSESASEVLRALGLNDRAHSSRLPQGGLTLKKVVVAVRQAV